MGEQSKDDRVGYRRPPKEHRFQPGRSGNPAGRPPRSEIHSHAMAGETEVEIVRQLSETVNISTKDGIKAVQKRDVLVSQLLKLGFEGNLKALQLAVTIGASAEVKLKKDRLMLVEASLNYQRSCREKIAEYLAEGSEPPTFVPHPEDMLISPNDVRYIGPIDDMQHAAMLEVLNHRDELLEDISAYAQDAPHNEPDSAVCAAYAQAIEEVRRCNSALPPRLRKDPIIQVPTTAWGEALRAPPEARCAKQPTKEAPSHFVAVPEEPSPGGSSAIAPDVLEVRLAIRDAHLQTAQEFATRGCASSDEMQRFARALARLNWINGLLPVAMRREVTFPAPGTS